MQNFSEVVKGEGTRGEMGGGEGTRGEKGRMGRTGAGEKGCRGEGVQGFTRKCVFRSMRAHRKTEAAPAKVPTGRQGLRRSRRALRCRSMKNVRSANPLK